jgi:hypothetical protein
LRWPRTGRNDFVAEVLGEAEAAKLLEATLKEEKETDETLTGIAEEVNADAVERNGLASKATAPTRNGARRPLNVGEGAMPLMRPAPFLREVSYPVASLSLLEHGRPDRAYQLLSSERSRGRRRDARNERIRR